MRFEKSHQFLQFKKRSASSTYICNYPQSSRNTRFALPCLGWLFLQLDHEAVVLYNCTMLFCISDRLLFIHDNFFLENTANKNKIVCRNLPSGVSLVAKLTETQQRIISFFKNPKLHNELKKKTAFFEQQKKSNIPCFSASGEFGGQFTSQLNLAISKLVSRSATGTR